MATDPLDVAAVQQALREFAEARDWEQFHTPKNLIMALTGEVGELAELFQWKTDAESWAIMKDESAAEAVRDEIADVLNYVLRLADRLKIDLATAVARKLEKNEAKYPAEKVRGVARKYTELE